MSEPAAPTNVRLVVDDGEIPLELEYAGREGGGGQHLWRTPSPVEASGGSVRVASDPLPPDTALEISWRAAPFDVPPWVLDPSEALNTRPRNELQELQDGWVRFDLHDPAMDGVIRPEDHGSWMRDSPLERQSLSLGPPHEPRLVMREYTPPPVPESPAVRFARVELAEPVDWCSDWHYIRGQCRIVELGVWRPPLPRSSGPGRLAIDGAAYRRRTRGRRR